MGTYGNMVRSMLVILGMVAVLVAIVPRVQSIQQPPVDAASVVADAVRQSGLPFDDPGRAARRLVADERPVCGEHRRSADVAGGVDTPKDGYVAIRQTKNASPAWLQAATSGGQQTGTAEVAGTDVDEVLRPREQADQPGVGSFGARRRTSLATVITAIADDDEVVTFTTALTPAQPG